MSTLHVLTPTYKPVGGVVKIFDYVTHALEAGLRVNLWCPEERKDNPNVKALFAIKRFAKLRRDPRVTFTNQKWLAFGDDDLAFVSLPDNYEVALATLPFGRSPERIIHIIQNVRHINPQWREGYPNRLLTRPAARISINQIVADVIDPWLDPRAMHEVINLGHDVAFFAHERTGGLNRPIRVAATTWKSPIGQLVAERLAGDPRFEFQMVTDTATWQRLSDLYQWADVFLNSPGPEEGLYLPGLEAMAAGALVITPDVGGNMAYCRPGENCLLVGFEDVEGYVAALEQLAGAPEEEIERLRSGGYEVTREFDLSREREHFHDFLGRLRERITAFEK